MDVGGDLMEIDTDAKAPEGGAAPKQATPEPAVSSSGRHLCASLSKIYLIIKLMIAGCFNPRPRSSQDSGSSKFGSSSSQAGLPKASWKLYLSADREEGSNRDYWYSC